MGKQSAGRPKLPEKKVRNNFTIRLSSEEYEQLKTKQLEEGFATLASLIHSRIFSRQFYSSSNLLSLAEIGNLYQYIKELNAIGRNINQIARKVETMDDGSEKPVIYELRKVGEKLDEIIRIEKMFQEVVNKSLEARGMKPNKSETINNIII